MTRETRRQAGLLGTLGVAVVVYLRFGAGFSLGGSSDVTPAELPPIDARGLEKALKDVTTVKRIEFPIEDSNPDRNLFQYDVYKPAPPTPEEIEARRKAAEAEAVAREAQLRLEKEQQERLIAEQQAVAQEAARRAAEEAANPPKPVPPLPPSRPQPPEVNFKYVGFIGDSRNPLGVFEEGNNVFLARKGQVVQDRFKILEVGVAWSAVGWTDAQFKDHSPRRIELGQQR